MSSWDGPCLICSGKLDCSCPYDNKTINQTIKYIFKYLIIPKKNLNWIISNPKSFCRSCLQIVDVVVKFQRKVILLELQIQHEVEKIGKIITETTTVQNLLSKGGGGRLKIWERFKKPVVENYLEGILPSPSIRLKASIATKYNNTRRIHHEEDERLPGPSSAIQNRSDKNQSTPCPRRFQKGSESDRGTPGHNRTERNNSMSSKTQNETNAHPCLTQNNTIQNTPESCLIKKQPDQHIPDQNIRQNETDENNLEPYQTQTNQRPVQIRPKQNVPDRSKAQNEIHEIISEPLMHQNESSKNLPGSTVELSPIRVLNTPNPDHPGGPSSSKRSISDIQSPTDRPDLNRNKRRHVHVETPILTVLKLEDPDTFDNQSVDISNSHEDSVGNTEDSLTVFAPIGTVQNNVQVENNPPDTRIDEPLPDLRIVRVESLIEKNGSPLDNGNNQMEAEVSPEVVHRIENDGTLVMIVTSTLNTNETTNHSPLALPAPSASPAEGNRKSFNGSKEVSKKTKKHLDDSSDNEFESSSDESVVILCTKAKNKQTVPAPNKLDCPECDFSVKVERNSKLGEKKCLAAADVKLRNHFSKNHRGSLPKTLNFPMTVFNGNDIFKCPECNKFVAVKYKDGKDRKKCQTVARRGLSEHFRLSHRNSPLLKSSKPAEPTGSTALVKPIKPVEKSPKVFKEPSSSAPKSKSKLSLANVSQGYLNKYICDICDDLFPTKESMSDHVRGHIKCTVCADNSRRFLNYDSSLVHHYSLHLDRNEQKEALKDGTDLPRTLRESLISRGRDPNSFQFSNLLIAEAEIDKPVSDAIPFAEIDKLEVTKIGDIVCRICGLVEEKMTRILPNEMTPRQKMILHIKQHHIKRPFVCPACGIHFRSKAIIARHLIQHTIQNIRSKSRKKALEGK